MAFRCGNIVAWHELQLRFGIQEDFRRPQPNPKALRRLLLLHPRSRFAEETQMALASASAETRISGEDFEDDPLKASMKKCSGLIEKCLIGSC